MLKKQICVVLFAMTVAFCGCSGGGSTQKVQIPENPAPPRTEEDESGLEPPPLYVKE